jgi:hypothetical protein
VVTPPRARRIGLAWSLVGAPALGLWLLLWGESASLGRLGLGGGFVLLVVVPAIVGAGANVLLGSSRRRAAWCGVAAAAVSAVAFVALVVAFFLTVPDGFYN